MLGLRSLYFVLSEALHRLRYLRQGLAVILLFTGLKMISSDWISIGPLASIAVIAGVPAVTAFASLADAAHA
jgi:tellurite resistance protein TerC